MLRRRILSSTPLRFHVSTHLLLIMLELIKETLKSWGVELTAEQSAKLKLFQTELLEKNSRFNLVSANDAGRIWPRHILDALAAVPLLRRLMRAGSAVADAGAGAGLPGIPLAVAFEDLQFDFWDSSLKRQLFLTWVISRLGLKNAQAFHRRIGLGGPRTSALSEKARSGPPEAAGYDAVMERAMGKLDNILPQCLNMAKEGGIFLAWQSSNPAVLLPEGVRTEEIFAYRLPHEKKDRFIAVFRKDHETKSDG
ncbi:MAG: 16S rRNA (guanine(527)-N(7))-methyltransferase RsmG [Elusimicrobia bacterium]|nr:16S rRNA (guanine(527)-N(7))-methyltransferase RsmG [Elusimicrobiota bacterium]